MDAGEMAAVQDGIQSVFHVYVRIFTAQCILPVYLTLQLKMPFVPSKLLAVAVLESRQISRVLFESFLFDLAITAFLEFVGEYGIIMTTVCQWVPLALAELLNFCSAMEWIAQKKNI